MSDIREVEINGVKFEVDFSTARKIETYRVGNPVKVLVKKYGDEYEIKYGVIVDVVAFDALPTIQVMYLDSGYNSADFKIISFNEKSKNDFQIAPLSDHEIMLDKVQVLKSFDRKIADLQKEIDEVERKKKYFTDKFNTAFASEVME